MKWLQQAFAVKVYHKQIVPSVTECGDTTIIRYDSGNEHIQFTLTDEQLYNPITYQLVRNQVKHWMVK